MPGCRSSTKPWPAHGLAMTAATTATRAAGLTSRPPSLQISSTMVTILRTVMSGNLRVLFGEDVLCGDDVFRGDDGVGRTVADAGVRTGAGGGGGDHDDL